MKNVNAKIKWWLIFSCKEKLQQGGIINDGRKIAIWNIKADRLSSSRIAPTKLFVKKIANKNPTNPIIKLSFGDFANPLGTAPFNLWALTDERA